MAPVPVHLMKEHSPVGTIIPYGMSRFRVAEIKRFKCGIKCYRMVDPDSRNEWPGWWVSEVDILKTIRNPDYTWKHRWDTWSTPDGENR